MNKHCSMRTVKLVGIHQYSVHANIIIHGSKLQGQPEARASLCLQALGEFSVYIYYQ